MKFWRKLFPGSNREEVPGQESSRADSEMVDIFVNEVLVQVVLEEFGEATREDKAYIAAWSQYQLAQEGMEQFEQKVSQLPQGNNVLDSVKRTRIKMLTYAALDVFPRMYFFMLPLGNIFEPAGIEHLAQIAAKAIYHVDASEMLELLIETVEEYRKVRHDPSGSSTPATGTLWHDWVAQEIRMRRGADSYHFNFDEYDANWKFCVECQTNIFWEGSTARAVAEEIEQMEAVARRFPITAKWALVNMPLSGKRWRAGLCPRCGGRLILNPSLSPSRAATPRPTDVPASRSTSTAPNPSRKESERLQAEAQTKRTPGLSLDKLATKNEPESAERNLFPDERPGVPRYMASEGNEQSGFKVVDRRRSFNFDGPGREASTSPDPGQKESARPEAKAQKDDSHGAAQTGDLQIVEESTTGNIHDAARDGKLGQVKALIKDNPDLALSRDKNGQTPLHAAVIGGHKGVAELLLDSKALVNTRDNKGNTPTRWAAIQGHKDMEQLLRQRGGRE